MSDSDIAKAGLLMLKGMMADAPEKERRQLQNALESLRDWRTTYGQAGDIAIQMVALELACE